MVADQLIVDKLDTAAEKYIPSKFGKYFQQLSNRSIYWIIKDDGALIRRYDSFKNEIINGLLEFASAQLNIPAPANHISPFESMSKRLCSEQSDLIPNILIESLHNTLDLTKDVSIMAHSASSRLQRNIAVID